MCFTLSFAAGVMTVVSVLDLWLPIARASLLSAVLATGALDATHTINTALFDGRRSPHRHALLRRTGTAADPTSP